MSIIYQEVITGIVSGVSGKLIHVEVEIRNGLPYFTMVGYLSKESMEAKERVASALRSIGHPLPSMKITVNLSPANIRKNGTAFDFPIAVAFLGCLNLIDASKLDDICIMGELGLNGKIRGVGNCLPIVLEARKQGIHKFFAASEDENSLRGIEDIEVVFMDSLQDVLDYFHGTYHQKSCRSATTYQKEESEEDFSDIIGQQHLKRAMEIAVTGRHHLLIIGSPGSGKTMIAKRIPSILPDLTFEEALDVTKIHSISGMLDNNIGIVTTRPFRSPHHTISPTSMIGGGRNPKPGEISLAHNGVLFLDELPEFNRTTLEVLRGPLEDKNVTISRLYSKVEYPSNFMLIASMNPCPCGYYGSEEKSCNCSGQAIEKYLNRISGPLLDRIDLHVEVKPVKYEKLNSEIKPETSEKIKKRVNNARRIQYLRYKGMGIYSNAELTPQMIEKYCQIDEQSKKILEQAFKKLGLSARAYSRILKVARTIADLESKENIERQHILEAIQYRSLDRKYGDKF